VDDKELKINTEEGIPTAKIVNFFNDLFDSVNGDDKKNDEHNELRCPVSENSVHHSFWVSAKSVLRNMYYVEKVSRKIVKSVPTLSNWLFTIDGFQKLWKIINEKFDFKILKTRYCNQDPLENFFGQIRSHAVRHTNPTPRQFEDSFITLLVNNIKFISIIGGNCEITGDGFLLFSLEEYLKDDVSNIEVHDVRNDYYDEQFDLVTDKIVANESIVALLLENPQEIIKSILKKVNYCSECQDNFKNSEFLICIKQVICSINKLLKTKAHQRNILKIILQHFQNWNINMNWHDCINHHVDIFNIIVHVIAVKTIVCWCEKRNALINNNNVDNNNLEHDIVKDIFEMKRMREHYKNEKCKRRENLEKYRNCVRRRM